MGRKGIMNRKGIIDTICLCMFVCIIIIELNILAHVASKQKPASNALTQEEKAFADKIVLTFIRGCADKADTYQVNSENIKFFYKTAYTTILIRRRFNKCLDKK